MSSADLERLYARAADPQRYPAYLYTGRAGGKTGLNGWRERVVAAWVPCKSKRKSD